MATTVKKLMMHEASLTSLLKNYLVTQSYYPMSEDINLHFFLYSAAESFRVKAFALKSCIPELFEVRRL
jgi:hypothetical protein